MSTSGSRPPGSAPPRVVPTLTEVVDGAARKPAATAPAQPVKAPPAAAAPPVKAAPAAPATTPTRTAAVPAPAAGSDEELVQRVLGHVLRQVDQLIEHRLRETLAPTMARLTDSLVQAARDELAATLRDVVAKAVAQELARRRSR